jgi:LmbE family N-acetylglucosaminyl deacetylase
VVNTIEGMGTSEKVWLPFLGALGLPRLVVDPAPDRAVVVAPHPDDEVLGVGGLMTMLAAAGTCVEVVSVTDGEASHPGGSLSPQDLGRKRAAETVAALDLLGVRAEVGRLRLPDGGRQALEQPVVDSLRLTPGAWLLGPWARDGHPDHEAVGRACARVAARDGARLLEYPVWGWHWATPDEPRMVWSRALQVELPADVRVAKAWALAEFATQIRPVGPTEADAAVLPPHVLERFTRPWEVVFS